MLLQKQAVIIFLTHISLASFLWDIGKQNRPRCDATKHGVPSENILFADKIFIEKKKKKTTPEAPTKENGLIQMIRMGKSIGHKWVKFHQVTQHPLIADQDSSL